jgi:toxin ParE1/3/4
LVYRASALADLAQTRAFVARQSTSLAVARRFTDRLRERCARLATLPGTLGRERPELAPGLRSVVEADYVILFRYAAEDRLEIIRIMHGHRDPGPLFAPPGAG